MASTSPRLLLLPQELRDLIYEHALSDALPWPETFIEHRTNTVAQEPTKDNPEGPIQTYSAQSPRPIWYTLLLCCKTTNKDIRELVQTTALKQKSYIPPAVIDLTLSSTTATAMWQRIPCHPRQISELHVNIRVSQIYEACFTSGAPDKDNTIIRALFHLLKQYCCNGPHLARRSALSTPLMLETVVLTIEPDFSIDMAQRFFANPIQQLATISGVLWIWLGRFAGSGLLYRHIGKLIYDCKYIAEARERVMEFKVANNSWDAMDRRTFQDLGYSCN